uniref:Uncharacterized protein n=1 Tax=Chromera velia CCMP2878 TaxID=1169474 RepID=A0A0G4IFP7_9ALVE|eukprot:Cvel_14096.t1-p1 / transcript=Cvel_14096.t1 / gene=Cvel_14096 / organism=Chromera_velia_CCMP2878 / gene_product=hypothetical protein / transcript_product=hypothetical protein / location=Cvel_scaffold990:54900-57252(-) / protein_length=241 / sequence_SO=supercontig / SO=protein_coding / is_pseudo=false
MQDSQRPCWLSIRAGILNWDDTDVVFSRRVDTEDQQHVDTLCHTVPSLQKYISTEEVPFSRPLSPPTRSKLKDWCRKAEKEKEKVPEGGALKAMRHALGCLEEVESKFASTNEDLQRLSLPVMRGDNDPLGSSAVPPSESHEGSTGAHPWKTLPTAMMDKLNLTGLGFHTHHSNTFNALKADSRLSGTLRDRLGVGCNITRTEVDSYATGDCNHKYTSFEEMARRMCTGDQQQNCDGCIVQ